MLRLGVLGDDLGQVGATVDRLVDLGMDRAALGPFIADESGRMHLVLGVADRRPDTADLADVWIDSTSDVARELDLTAALERFMTFDRNHSAGRRAPRRRSAMLSESDAAWASAATRLIARLAAAMGDLAVRIDHIGSTSVPGLPAKDLVDIQIAVESGNEIAAARAAIAAGVVHVPGPWFGTDRHGVGQPEEVCVDADPGRPVNVNIRPVGSAVWRDALLFRDWLRASGAAREEYTSVKRSLIEAAGGDVDAYGDGKAPWVGAALLRADAWAERTGWTP